MDLIKVALYALLLNIAVGLGYLLLSSNIEVAELSSAFSSLPDYWSAGADRLPSVLDKAFALNAENFVNLPFSLITWATLLTVIFLLSLVLSWFITEGETKITLAILTTLCANILFLESYFYQ